MEKLIEIKHSKLFEELKPKIVNKINGLKNRYTEEILVYDIQHFLDEENGVLTISCAKYGINWYVVFLTNTIEIYEEAPFYIKSFISDYRAQLISAIQKEV